PIRTEGNGVTWALEMKNVGNRLARALFPHAGGIIITSCRQKLAIPAEGETENPISMPQSCAYRLTRVRIPHAGGGCVVSTYQDGSTVEGGGCAMSEAWMR